MIYSKDNLRQIFQQPFNAHEWQQMLQHYFQATELRAEPERIDCTTADEQGYYLGAIDTTDSYRIGLFYYQIQHGNVARKRVGLRNLVKSFVNPNWGEFDAALVVFDSGELWRLSFVSDIKGESTAPKRYTYVFGEGESFYNTPVGRFDALQRKGISFENIKDAFSVEALSKEFFDEYREHYADIVEYITGKRYVKEKGKWVEKTIHEPCHEIFDQFVAVYKDPEKTVRDYIKKLMGRLVFLQFLQKKEWMGVPADRQDWKGGDTRFLQNKFNEFADKDNFIDGFLEPLFNDLNTNRQNNNDLASPKVGSDIKIPFLNGGLFQLDEEDCSNIRLPQHLLGDVLDFFERYNFTIDENDPNDAQIGVDPEMLGRVFENLLEDNKDKGAFYTPKEIVQYMCQESLIAYLQTGIDDETDKESIRQFVLTHEVGHLGSMAEDVSIKLLNVKICDPAIGSGAFPMGLLRQLYLCQCAIHPELEEKNAADIKRHIIQNNIYGVDIEKGAVDIARLRFWLALVVDEHEPQSLPNLDYKIMCGNSLLHRFALNAPFQDVLRDYNQKNGTHYTLADYRQWTYDYTDISDHIQKETFRQKIEDIKRAVKTELSNKEKDKISKVRGRIDLLTMGDLFEDRSKENEKKIKDLQIELQALEQQRVEIKSNKIYDQAFEWRFEFPALLDENGEFKGFDIVIGNPPYLSYYSRQAVPIDEKILAIMKKNSRFITNKTARGRFHSVQFFLDKGLNLINSTGICTYIIDISFFEKPFKDIRAFVLDNYHVKEIVSELTAFENVASGQVILAIDNEASNNTRWKLDISGESFRISSDVWKNSPEKEFYLPKEDGLLTKVEKNALTLSELGDVRTGVNIGGVKQYFLSDNPIFYPFISGGDNVQAYYIHYPTNAQKRKRETFFNFSKEIEKKIWDSHIGTPSIGENNNRFVRPKIIIRQGDVRVTAALDIDRHFHCGYTLFTFNVTNDDILLLKYILGILNSTLITYYMRERNWIKVAPGKNPQIRVSDVKNIPILVNDESKTGIISYVDDLLGAKRNNPSADTSVLEIGIDFLVYHLYGLTYDEILIVDPETPITREEYEKKQN